MNRIEKCAVIFVAVAMAINYLFSPLYAQLLSQKEIIVGMMVQSKLARNQTDIKKIENESSKLITEVLRANDIEFEDVKSWTVDLKTGKLTFINKEGVK